MIRVDIGGLERHFAKLERDTMTNLDQLLVRNQDDAEDTARVLLNLQVYDTPERGGYKRTRSLWRSVYALRLRESRTVWSLVVGAVGGARGRSYALYVERGTYAGRIDLEQVWRDAQRVGQDLIHLEYGRPDAGMEPRPFTIPTVVMIVNSWSQSVLEAIREAERTSAPARGA